MSHMKDIEVPHTFEMAEGSHPFEADTSTTIEVTPKIVIEAPIPHMATKAPTTSNMDVTPPFETNVTAPALTYSFVDVTP